MMFEAVENVSVAQAPPEHSESRDAQGPGIEPQHLKHIFSAFRRGNPHGEDGVGLGLSIAARAAKLLGGELSVKSRLGGGSAFSLALSPHTSNKKGVTHGTSS